MAHGRVRVHLRKDTLLLLGRARPEAIERHRPGGHDLLDGRAPSRVAHVCAFRDRADLREFELKFLLAARVLVAREEAIEQRVGESAETALELAHSSLEGGSLGMILAAALAEPPVHRVDRPLADAVRDGDGGEPGASGGRDVALGYRLAPADLHALPTSPAAVVDEAAAGRFHMLLAVPLDRMRGVTNEVPTVTTIVRTLQVGPTGYAGPDAAKQRERKTPVPVDQREEVGGAQRRSTGSSRRMRSSTR